MKQIQWMMAGLLTIALCGLAVADDKKPGKDKPKRQALTKVLELSKEQIKDYRAATKELNAKTKAIRENKDLDKKAKSLQMRAIQKERIEALKKICTDEQKKKLEDIIAKRKKGGKKKNKDK